MEKLLIAVVVSIGLAACGDNNNPSGTPSSDSPGMINSSPDTASNSMQTTPTDSSAASSPGRTGEGSTGNPDSAGPGSSGRSR